MSLNSIKVDKTGEEESVGRVEWLETSVQGDLRQKDRPISEEVDG